MCDDCVCVGLVRYSWFIFAECVVLLQIWLCTPPLASGLSRQAYGKAARNTKARACSPVWIARPNQDGLWIKLEIFTLVCPI